MRDNQKRNRLLAYNIIIIVSIAFSVAFGLGACKPKTEETTLSFETIEQDVYAVGPGTLTTYEPREPGMVVISRVGEMDNLDGLVSEEGMRQLQALDYSQYFALAAFQGQKGSIGYDIQVNRIGRLGDTVNVYAQLNEPSPDIAVGAMNTSPYHVVKVQKSGSWNQNITFNLFSGDKLVASLTHSIP
jgi:hypothetical protein